MDWEKIRIILVLVGGSLAAGISYFLARVSKKYKLEVRKLELEIMNLEIKNEKDAIELNKLKDTTNTKQS